MGPSPLSLYPPHPATADGSWRHRGEQGGILLAGSSGQWDGRGVAFLSTFFPTSRGAEPRVQAS